MKNYLYLFMFLMCCVTVNASKVLTISKPTDVAAGITVCNVGHLITQKVDYYGFFLVGGNSKDIFTGQDVHSTVGFVYWDAAAEANDYFKYGYIQIISGKDDVLQSESESFPEYLAFGTTNQPFRFCGFDYYTDDNTEKILVEGYRSKQLIGSVTLSLPTGKDEDGFDHHPTFTTDLFPVETFGAVDVVCISKTGLSESTALPGSTNLFNNFAIDNPTVTLSESAENSTTINTTLSGSQYANITLMRTLKHGQWNTLCLPFSLTTQAISATLGNVNIQRLTSSIKNNGVVNLVFNKTSDIEAGVPYLIWPEDGSDIVNPTFNGVTVTSQLHPSETTYATFTGVIDPVTLTNGDKNTLFLSSDGTKLLYPNTDARMNGLRGYFTIKNSDGAASYSLKMDGATTDINKVSAVSMPTKQEIYNMAGISVDSTNPGLIIMNGKKIANKRNQ